MQTLHSVAGLAGRNRNLMRLARAGLLATARILSGLARAWTLRAAASNIAAPRASSTIRLRPAATRDASASICAGVAVTIVTRRGVPMSRRANVAPAGAVMVAADVPVVVGAVVMVSVGAVTVGALVNGLADRSSDAR